MVIKRKQSLPADGRDARPRKRSQGTPKKITAQQKAISKPDPVPENYGQDVKQYKSTKSWSWILHDLDDGNYWELALLKTSLSRAELCSYLNFLNTDKLRKWEQGDARRWDFLRNWASCKTQLCQLLDVFRIICCQSFRMSVLMQGIEQQSPWPENWDFLEELLDIADLRDLKADESSLQVVAITAWMLRQRQNRPRFPASKRYEPKPKYKKHECFKGQPPFWYAPEDVNRVFLYLRNMVENPLDYKDDRIRKRVPIEWGRSQKKGSLHCSAKGPDGPFTHWLKSAGAPAISDARLTVVRANEQSFRPQRDAEGGDQTVDDPIAATEPVLDAQDAGQREEHTTVIKPQAAVPANEQASVPQRNMDSTPPSVGGLIEGPERLQEQDAGEQEEPAVEDEEMTVPVSPRINFQRVDSSELSGLPHGSIAVSERRSGAQETQPEVAEGDVQEQSHEGLPGEPLEEPLTAEEIQSRTPAEEHTISQPPGSSAAAQAHHGSLPHESDIVSERSDSHANFGSQLRRIPIAVLMNPEPTVPQDDTQFRHDHDTSTVDPSNSYSGSANHPQQSLGSGELAQIGDRSLSSPAREFKVEPEETAESGPSLSATHHADEDIKPLTLSTHLSRQADLLQKWIQTITPPMSEDRDQIGLLFRILRRHEKARSCKQFNRVSATIKLHGWLNMTSPLDDTAKERLEKLCNQQVWVYKAIGERVVVGASKYVPLSEQQIVSLMDDSDGLFDHACKMVHDEEEFESARRDIVMFAYRKLGA
ncbi:hypothetical protein BDV96DRAFT_650996 [Lophiotrema nucula]|uniref:Uncharacterized protein n=1 Tax=Lophiotrema nucula TaxID=690887 RepID=A0A6A5YT99_9PLEO|nr:hypothetical protein BDV96DRAFT_650996 [Lophiotrema nucula]